MLKDVSAPARHTAKNGVLPLYKPITPSSRLIRQLDYTLLRRRSANNYRAKLGKRRERVENVRRSRIGPVKGTHRSALKHTLPSLRLRASERQGQGKAGTIPGHNFASPLHPLGVPLLDTRLHSAKNVTEARVSNLRKRKAGQTGQHLGSKFQQFSVTAERPSVGQRVHLHSGHADSRPWHTAASPAAAKGWRTS